MKFIRAALSLSLLFNFSCQKELTPKELQKEENNINLVGSVELKEGVEFSGYNFNQFIGVWEIVKVQTATMVLDVPKTINSSFLAKINADGSINWLREEKPNFGFCAADSMKLFSRDDNLIIGYQDVLFDEDDKLVGKPEEKYILIDFDVEGENDLKLRGEVPQGIAVIPELGYTIKPGDTVDYILKKVSDFDQKKVIETELNADLCDRKLVVLGKKDQPTNSGDAKEGEIPEDSEEDLPVVDRNDYIQSALRISNFKLIKGKMDGELSEISESEEPKVKSVKFSGDKDKALEAVFHFAVDKLDFDGLQIEMAAKKGRWGQYEPKLELFIFNAEDASWKLIDGTELFFKGANISNDLFKETSKYLVDVNGKKEIQIKIKSDLNRLEQCKFFKLLPCTIQPSILVDFIKVSTLRNPFKLVQNPLCPRKDLKGFWDILEVSAVATPEKVVKLGAKEGSDDLSPGKTIFTVRENFSAGSGKNKKLQVYVEAKDHTTGQEGWNFCPDKKYNYKLDYEKCTLEMDPVREGMKNSLYDIEIYSEGENKILEMKMIYATENAYMKMIYRPDVKKAPKAKFKFDCIR